MKYVVTPSCVGCGMCEWMCPEMFHVVEGRSRVVGVEDSPLITKKIMAVIENCPAQAIYRDSEVTSLP